MAPFAPILRGALVAAALLALLALLPHTASALDRERQAPSAAFAAPVAGSALAAAVSAPPSGFQETVAFGGLVAPTAIRFAPDGRVFVAEKRGRILEYDSMADPTPAVFADLRTQVADYWDRGLLGLALDPGFTSGRPFVYVLYTYDKDPNSPQVPRWNDACPTPPGPTGEGCMASGRLSKLSAGGGEQVLITDWCQQYPSHSVGDLAFGPDGALYASAGDGASFNFADYGQDGLPINPCGDPPAGIDGDQTPPTAEGGALRSQDVRTPADPTGGDGTILRIDPDTGAAAPGNPLASSADPMARRIVALGLRNPFRLTVRPGTSEVWAGDVGWGAYEEINRVAAPTAGTRNFGWPCYEGPGRMASYDNLNLNLCESLYAQPAQHAAPAFAYRHSERVVTGEACPSGTSSVAGLAFYTGTQFPARYRDGLFFADYSRKCIWFVPAGADGLPDFSRRETFASGARGVVNLTVGPDGALYYPSLDDGDIKRIAYLTQNAAPVARIGADPAAGAAPLTVEFDGTTSSDPDGDPLTYAWDLDGDGGYDDSTAAAPSWTYATAGTVTVRLRVTDPGGQQGTATTTITAGAPPRAEITAPAAATTWAVGDSLAFAGRATDAQGAELPASRLSWRVLLQHCSPAGDDCHTHVVQDFAGTAGGTVVAPDHEYPSHLALELTARDASGLADVVTRRLDPRTVDLSFESDPAGLQLSVGSFSGAAPFTRRVIAGSTLSVSAPAPQTLGGSGYGFASWSDGGAQTHSIVAPATATTYRAAFSKVVAAPGLVGAWSFDEPGGTTALDASGRSGNGTISGATRAAGRHGGALAFDGADDWVTIADTAALDLTAGMTLEAWVNPSGAGSRWRTVGLKERGGGLAYALYADDGTTRPQGFASTGASDAGAAGAAGSVPANAWTHLATTYDGTALRVYVNGTLAGSRAMSGSLATSAGPLRLGGNASWLDEFFQGRIDEVRVYDRALSAAQIAADMATPIGGDVPPRLDVSPGSLSFAAQAGGAAPAAKTLSVSNAGGGSLEYAVADDAPWLSVSPASGTAPATVTASVDPAGLAAGTYSASITATASGAQGSPVSIPVTLTVAPAPPGPELAVSPGELAFSATAGGAAPAARTLGVTNAGGGTLSFAAADDAAWLSVSPGTGTAPATLSVTADPAGLAVGTHRATISVTAAGAAGSPRTVPVTFTVGAAPPPPPPPPPPGGLVAAYGFDEAGGTVVGDASGAGNPGVLSGAGRTAAGRFGGALSFDGVDDWVTVADSPSLDLSTAMTLEAWVHPTALGSAWRTVLLKERPAGLSYALYANDDRGRPHAFAFTGAERGTRGPGALPLNTWTHLATTYASGTLRLYVNGTQVSSASVGTPLRTSGEPLRIGGNAVWDEWFRGRIDEVRVYDRALTAAEIAGDMSRAVGAPALARATRAAVAARHAARVRKARRRASLERERARRDLPLGRHAHRRGRR